MLSLASARIIVETVLRKGHELGLGPLTAAVLDPGGHLVALNRDDGSGILRPEIAIGKAWGVLGLGLPARELARRAERMPEFFAALNAMSGGKVVPVPGGVLIGSPGRVVVGAVGVSGDTSDQDEACALHGVRAAGLRPWTDGDGPPP